MISNSKEVDVNTSIKIDCFEMKMRLLSQTKKIIKFMIGNWQGTFIIAIFESYAGETAPLVMSGAIITEVVLVSRTGDGLEGHNEWSKADNKLIIQPLFAVVNC
jgi:hypothetical protein